MYKHKLESLAPRLFRVAALRPHEGMRFSELAKRLSRAECLTTVRAPVGQLICVLQTIRFWSIPLLSFLPLHHLRRETQYDERRT